MSKRLIGPFNELTGLGGSNAEDGDALLDCMDQVRSALEGNGCKCVGSDSVPRDSDWGADISELVCRTIPHDIHSFSANGESLVETVSVRLDTLKVEIDSKGEVCAWIYEES